jgi:hypothetical protein
MRKAPLMRKLDLLIHRAHLRLTHSPRTLHDADDDRRQRLCARWKPTTSNSQTGRRQCCRSKANGGFLSGDVEPTKNGLPFGSAASMLPVDTHPRAPSVSVGVGDRPAVLLSSSAQKRRTLICPRWRLIDHRLRQLQDAAQPDAAIVEQTWEPCRQCWPAQHPQRNATLRTASRATCHRPPPAGSRPSCSATTGHASAIGRVCNCCLAWSPGRGSATPRPGWPCISCTAAGSWRPTWFARPFARRLSLMRALSCAAHQASAARALRSSACCARPPRAYINC